MFCPHCGTENHDNNFRCTKCSKVIQRVAQPVVTTELADSRTARMLLPVGRSGWAIAAGYAGLFALTIVLAPIAIALGIIAIMHLRKHPKLHGMGRAVFGVVMGVAGTVVLVWAFTMYRGG